MSGNTNKALRYILLSTVCMFVMVTNLLGLGNVSTQFSQDFFLDFANLPRCGIRNVAAAPVAHHSISNRAENTKTWPF